jgi:hypothetical protein
MQFQTPQFIEVEDKVIGPLTLKQFVYIAGSLGLAFLVYRFLPGLIGIPIAILILGFGAALSFYKVNGKPFVVTLEAAIKYGIGSKLYIWRKRDKKIVSEKTPSENVVSPLYVPRLSESKLRDLAWSLDIKETVNPGTEEMAPGKERQKLFGNSSR